MEIFEAGDHNGARLRIVQRAETNGLHMVGKTPDGRDQALIAQGAEPRLPKVDVGENEIVDAAGRRGGSRFAHSLAQLCPNGPVHLARGVRRRMRFKLPADFENVSDILERQAWNHEAARRANQIALIRQSQQRLARRHARNSVAGGDLDIDETAVRFDFAALEARPQVEVDALAETVRPRKACRRLHLRGVTGSAERTSVLHTGYSIFLYQAVKRDDGRRQGGGASFGFREVKMDLIRDDIHAMEDLPILEVWRMGFSIPDVIGLWAGEPDIPTPPFICDEAIAALRAGHTFYTHNRGIPELRDALRRYLLRLYGKDIGDDRLAVTTAGMNAVQILCQAMLGAGSKAVAITPSWPNIMRAMTISGAQVTEVPLRRSNAGWSLDLDAVVEACQPGTKMLYLATPANPTGWAISPEEAEALLALTRERGIALVSDEVYHRIVYDRPVAFSFLQLARPDDAVFVVNSFSKSWAMTGWRMGWLVYPAGFQETAEKLIQFNTSGGQAFLQHGAVAALEHGESFVAEFVARCRAGRDIVSDRLAKMARVREVASNGSFYSMFEVDGVTNTLDFCKGVVTGARVGLAPGSAFGKGAESLIRLCYAKSADNLETAMDRLDQYLRVN